LHDLGAMAVQIMAASERRARGSAPDRVGLTQHRIDEDGLDTARREISLVERPPAAGVLTPVGGSDA
jgi:hypothetical protein